MKLLSSLLWTEALRNTRNCGKPWSTCNGHSFPQRSSGVQKSSHFARDLNTQSVWFKFVPQSDLKAWTYILKISEFQIGQEKANRDTHKHTNTHTKCWYTVCYLVSKFLNFHLLNYNVEQTRSHWTPGHLGALHQFAQSEWEVFFQGFLCIPK
jgi:hypothetical protein